MTAPRIPRLALAAFVLAAAGGAAFACRSLTCEDTKTCDDGSTAGSDAAADGTTTDGAAGDGAVPEGCELSPAQNPAVLSERCGIFVSATGGSDTGFGTPASPFKSMARVALSLENDPKPWVFFCASKAFDVDTTLTLESGKKVGFFGRLECGGGTGPWSVADASKRTVLNGPAGGEPVIRSNGASVRLEGMELLAKDATQPGGSSIGVFANGGSLVVDGCVVRAGAGVNGDAGVSAPQDGGARAEAGVNATGSTGGGLVLCMCGTEATSGGAGGTNIAKPNGDPGTPGYDAGGGANGAGGVASAGDCSLGSAGRTGATGPAGDAGTIGSRGAVSVSGWTPASGADGHPGRIGQGGGGGASLSGGGGGGGGCGGCGGAPGAGGQGGGSSICILSFGATVSLFGSQLFPGTGGLGGIGGLGQPGQPGGNPGQDPAANGCAGGKGGTGGAGGRGGDGAPGLSVGVLYKGPAPSLGDASVATTDASTSHAALEVN